MTDITQEHPAEQLLTLDEVCEYLRISRWSLYQLINDRRLNTVRIGTRRLVAPQDFQEFLDALRADGNRQSFVSTTPYEEGR